MNNSNSNSNSNSTDTGTSQLEVLLRKDEAGVRIVTMNRPKRRNALDTALTQALVSAIRQADADTSVGALVITGAAPSFSAGADLGEFAGERADAAAEELRADLYLELQLLFNQTGIPLICAVTGHALGVGAALAVAADITVMGEGAKLGYPELLHGMVPSGMISHLQRRVGRKKAYELLALAQPISAGDALLLGLVNQVVADAQVVERAIELGKTLAGYDRSALRETKLLFVELADLPLEDSLRSAAEASKRRRELRRGTDNS